MNQSCKNVRAPGRAVKRLAKLVSLRRAIVLSVAAAAGLTLGQTAHAQSGTWTSTTSGGLWSDIANWSSGAGPVADGATFTADFSTLDLTADTTVRLDSSRSITNLTFGDTATATAGGWILDNNGNVANILTLAGPTPTITVNALGTSKNAAISAQLTGSDGLIKAGAGILYLQTANTYTGGTILNAGQFDIGDNLALSTGGLTINGGNITPRLTARNLANPVTVGGNFSLGTVGVNNSLTLSGTINLGGVSRTITINNTTAFSGVVSSGTLVKTGAGTLTLSNANTYAGGTTISNDGGTIAISNNTALGTGAISIVTGGSNAKGRLQLSNNITVSNNINFAGMLASATATDARLENVSGNNTVTGTVTFYTTGGAFTNIISTAGSLTLANMTATTVTGARTFNFAGAGATTVGGNITNGSATVGVTKVGTGTLTLGGTNTYTGVTTINGGTLSVGSIGNGGVSGNLGAATSVATNLLLGGGTLQYTGATASTDRNFTLTDATTSTIDVSSSATNLTMTGVSTATTGALAKAGAGTLTIPNANSYSGGTTINDGGGTLAISNSASLGTGAIGIGTNATTGSNARLQLSGNITLTNAVNLAGQTASSSATSARLENVSGNNTISGPITFAQLGGGVNNIIATSGSLALNGNMTTTTVTGARSFNFSGAGAISVAGVISDGTATVGVINASTLTLSGANTYTGNTTINAGSLVLTSTGSIANSAQIIVGSGATYDVQAVSGYTLGSAQTLSGIGTVQGNVTLAAGANLSPGTSPGTLTFANNLDLSATGTSNSGDLQFELGTSSDRVVLSSGTLSIGTGTLGFNDFAFTDLAGFGPGTYTLFQTGSLISGSLDGSNLTGTVGGISATLGFANGGNDLVLNVAAIPEPSTLVLGSLGGLGLAIYGVRRRRQQ